MTGVREAKMYYQIKALVLNAQTHNEHDKQVTLYSYQWGKIKAVVPSAKKITAKLSAATEPLTESEFMVFQSHPSMRPKITGALIINNNTDVKTDFIKNLYALYAAEICDKFAPFNLEHFEKYDLLSRVWEVLGQTKTPKRVLTAFALRFLKLSGYSYAEYLKNNPELDGETQKTIRMLSNCSGDDLECFNTVDDDRIWNFVESYMTTYIKRPSVGVFLKKISGLYFV